MPSEDKLRRVEAIVIGVAAVVLLIAYLVSRVWQ